MFEMSATTLLFTGLLLFWISASTAEKSHHMWIDRVETNVNKEWIAENVTIKIRKVNKTEKHMNVSTTVVKDITQDLTCEMKVYQQMGGKYLKAPANFPPGSCCGFIERNQEFWSCITKFSNFPNKCPITAGDYYVKEFNANECEVRFVFPPHLPEHYKVDFKMSRGATPVFSAVAYGTIKIKFWVFEF